MLWRGFLNFLELLLQLINFLLQYSFFNIKLHYLFKFVILVVQIKQLIIHKFQYFLIQFQIKFSPLSFIFILALLHKQIIFMKNRITNQISPWNVKDENMISMLNDVYDYSDIKFLAPIKSFSQIKQKNRISVNESNKKIGMPSVYKNLDVKNFSEQKKSKRNSVKVQNFSKTQTFDIKFKGINHINHTELKKSKEIHTKLITRRIFSKVLKSNPQKILINKEKQFEKNYSDLKTKLQSLMKNHKSQERLLIKREKQKIQNINSKLMYQSVKTIDPFIYMTQRLGNQNRDLKNLKSHYLDKLIGKYQ